MVAAEELGGPVVGELEEVGDDELAAGFTAGGRVRRSRKAPPPVADGLRQRRIDEIWGPAGDEEEDERREKDAAGEEIQALIGELFRASVSGGQYVQLERDSAAARFLVRAKVAQFHPKDARRLRLMDFGRELDD
ncbi:hypothetical protein BDY21DRAFT_45026 [Lineolata rhizophorae]|uniref:Uncharacterized protein n=1 Tax=Lineolata rhizophorae TaxID=578093 RepID=A0A6A6P079_9PEZI|nr:hypothetical protein BDY21DRAFT_45026 [Lineolata rhizophorae]